MGTFQAAQQKKSCREEVSDKPLSSALSVVALGLPVSSQDAKAQDKRSAILILKIVLNHHVSLICFVWYLPSLNAKTLVFCYAETCLIE